MDLKAPIRRILRFMQFQNFKKIEKSINAFNTFNTTVQNLIINNHLNEGKGSKLYQI